MAGDQRHRALGERAHRLAQVHVEGVQLVGQGADLVDDRRHHHLHRLGEAEPVAADQGVDRAVEVLGVRGARLDRDAEHPRLLAQLLDRVDLAVVAEHREGLHALEGGPGVGRVAVVAEAADRLEALVEQVGVVLAEDLRRAHHLVDAGRRREGGDVDAELAAPARSAGRRGRGRGARRRRRGRRPARSAAPPRARSGRARASRRRRSARRGCGSRPGRAARGRRAGPCSQVLGALDEDVGDGEGVVEGERGVVAAGANLLGPDLARDVDQQAAAVTLAVDVAGAVEHLLQRRDRQRRSARGSASRPCAPRRRSRRRPCPRRWAERRAAGRRARASSGRGRLAAKLTGLALRQSTSRVPRLLRAGARRVDESGHYRGRPCLNRANCAPISAKCRLPETSGKRRVLVARLPGGRRSEGP